MSKTVLSEEEKFNLEMKKLTSIVRASQGKTPEPQDVISSFINVKEMLERTGFPTYTILSQCVYLEVGYKKFGEDSVMIHTWALTLMKALIAYKRKQREEAIKLAQRIREGEETSFYFGQQKQLEQPKRRFWQRKQKQQTEFKEQ